MENFTQTELIAMLKPVIEGDFDFYKITFPMAVSDSTITKTISNTITKGEAKEKEILEIILNNPTLSVAQIAPLVKLSEVGVRYHLNRLKKKGKIRRKGHGRGGSWEVKK